MSERWIGKLVLQPLNDGRRMRVVQPFGYIDSSGKEWLVPNGAWTDGASIPKALWSIVGGPYEDKYRNAAVIHDYFCSKRSRSCKDVHRAFFEMTLFSGMNERQAKILYAAVRFGGPRWSDMDVHNVTLTDGGFGDNTTLWIHKGAFSGPIPIASILSFLRTFSDILLIKSDALKMLKSIRQGGFLYMDLNEVASEIEDGASLSEIDEIIADKYDVSGRFRFLKPRGRILTFRMPPMP